MLGSLARKLRIFGFDTYYHQTGTDEAMLKKARGEGRIILTADKALFAAAGKRGVPAFLISAGTDPKRLSLLSAEARSASVSLRRGESRCALCNGTLAAVGRDALKEKDSETLRRHRLFFMCDDCGKVYWRGGHWSRLRRLERHLV